MFCMDYGMDSSIEYRYMVWNPLFCVWVGVGNSQTYFLLALS